MYNVKQSKYFLFKNKKEQRYLKNLIEKSHNQKLQKFYENFSNCTDINSLKKLLKNSNIIKISPDIIDSFNTSDFYEIKEKLAYKINEFLLTNNI